MKNNSNKLIVNATPVLGNFTGVGQVVDEISKRLALDSSMEVDFYTPLKTFSNYQDFSNGSSSVRALKTVKGLFKRLPFKETLRKRFSGFDSCGPGYDIYWEPNFVPLKQIQAKNVVTTVHDMAFCDFPNWHPSDRLNYLRKNFGQNLDRSDLVVTVSEFSKQRLLATQKVVDEDRIRVIYNGVDHNLFKTYDSMLVSAFKEEKGLPKSFILFVGTVEPRKNLKRLLSAYKTLPESMKKEFPLILAGDIGWKNRKIFEDIENQKAYVKWIGYVQSRSELALLYNAATVFVYPSLYEGFGLPPLEAMACGTPVLLSDIPVFRELFGPSAAHFSDPIDIDAMADALSRLLTSNQLRQRLAKKGQEISIGYTWDKSYMGYNALFINFLG